MLNQYVMWRNMVVFFCFFCLCVALLSGCAADPCQMYFQRLKQNCRLDSTKEGAKLDEYLQTEFRDCQLDICARTSLSSINCQDPETHLPGGLTGSFLTCQ